MADTERGHWPGESCDDCGEKGNVVFKHWGPLVPPKSKIGFFCAKCLNERAKNSREGKEPLPLGANLV